MSVSTAVASNTTVAMSTTSAVSTNPKPDNTTYMGVVEVCVMFVIAELTATMG